MCYQPLEHYSNIYIEAIISSEILNSTLYKANFKNFRFLRWTINIVVLKDHPILPFPFNFLSISAKPKQENLNELKQELDIDFHKVTVAELCQRLGTNIDTGLTNAQVKANQVQVQ